MPDTKSRIFDSLPKKVQSAIATYAELAAISPDIVITFAIAHFLDPDSIAFNDCQTGVQPDRLQLLRYVARTLVTHWQIERNKNVPRLITNWLEVYQEQEPNHES